MPEMWKDKLFSVYVFAAVLLIITLVPLFSQWEEHPLAPAFAMMPEGNGKSGYADAYTTDPSRTHAEPETEGATPAAGTAPPPSTAPTPVDSLASLPSAPTDAAGASVPAPPSPGAGDTALASGPSDSPSPAAAAGTSATPSVPTPAPGGTPKAPASSKKPEKRSIPVLNYHSVAIVPGNVVVIHPDKFREQMKYLSDNGYHPLTLAEFTDILEGKQEPPDKPVLLTFDDGYTDNYTAAMPVLQELGFPATLFMSPGMVGQSGYIDWEQAKALQDNRWDIQPHGMTHPSLSTLTAEKQTFEITEARRLIEDKLGKPADIFCYPYGHYNRDTLDILSSNGFRYAFTIDQGKASSDQHPYKLKRIFVNGEEGLSSLVKKLGTSF